MNSVISVVVDIVSSVVVLTLGTAAAVGGHSKAGVVIVALGLLAVLVHLIGFTENLSPNGD